MKYAIALLVVFAIEGCTPIVGLFQGTTPGLFAQDAQNTPLNQQPCQESQALLKKVDTIYSLLASEFVSEGKVKDYDVFIKGLRSRRYACLIEEPESCCIHGAGSVACAGPCQGTTCARKRGCATNYILWVARNWPPICTSAWPNEPHCVAAGSARQQNYDDDLVHEVCEQTAWSYNLGDAAHATEYYTKTCAAVQQAYDSLVR